MPPTIGPPGLSPKPLTQVGTQALGQTGQTQQTGHSQVPAGGTGSNGMASVNSTPVKPLDIDPSNTQVDAEGHEQGNTQANTVGSQSRTESLAQLDADPAQQAFFKRMASGLTSVLRNHASTALGFGVLAAASLLTGGAAAVVPLMMALAAGSATTAACSAMMPKADGTPTDDDQDTSQDPMQDPAQLALNQPAFNPTLQEPKKKDEDDAVDQQDQPPVEVELQDMKRQEQSVENQAQDTVVDTQQALLEQVQAQRDQHNQSIKA